MKRMFFLITIATVITGSVLWGCKKDELLVLSGNEQVMLKSAAIAMEKECLPSVYPLVTRNNREIGHITVSNGGSILTVEFAGNGLAVSEVQLWIGTDPSMVPKNNNDVPVPGKFPYKASDYTAFHVPLSELFEPVPGGSYDGNEVYIFFHAEFEDSENKRNDKISAWSEGTAFMTSRWGSYSTYTVCAPPSGCFPSIAFGGDTFENEVYYYDNTGGGGGIQDIHTENGKVAGTVQYTSEALSFSFEQEWMFTDLLPAPLVLVYGYNDQPGTDPILVFEGEPTIIQESVTVPVPYYNYYKIQLKLQECY